ncbi:ABC transporter ATP-binding protein [Aeropyrum pernix]|uniref:ABC transporter ATP-binding protein n=1 Tax=Aeropyrum pernix TaxID=56636 RepID=UPI0013F1636E|nr:ABC transporter ATP-binding protein [Aeropyrum pernix]
MGFEVNASALSKRFGQRYAYRNVEFTFTSGVLGVLGPNGAGKTTLLKTILGLVKPSAGEILVEGVNPRSPWFEKLLPAIGYVPELPVVPLWTTPCILLETLARLEGYTTVEARVRAREALEVVGLAGECETPIGKLSKGARKRVLVAQAFIGERELLVLDEPYSGLDPEWVYRVRELLRTVAREGATVIVSSHILRELEDIATHVLVLKTDQLFYGSIEELRAWLSGTPRILLSVAEPERAVEVLRRGGFNAYTINKGGQLVVAVEGADDPARVLSLLLAENIEISEYRVEKASLEEAYLKLVGASNGLGGG